MKSMAGVLGLGLIFIAVLPLVALYVWSQFGASAAIQYFIIAYIARMIVGFLTKILITGNMVSKAERETGFTFTHESQMPDSITIANTIRDGLVSIFIPIIVYLVMF